MSPTGTPGPAPDSAVQPAPASRCCTFTLRRNPAATSKSSSCGAWSCSRARTARAGPALSNADRVAEASTTITGPLVRLPSQRRWWRCPRPDREENQAVPGCRRDATPRPAPSQPPPLPKPRPGRRAAPAAVRPRRVRLAGTRSSVRRTPRHCLPCAAPTGPVGPLTARATAPSDPREGEVAALADGAVSPGWRGSRLLPAPLGPRPR